MKISKQSIIIILMILVFLSASVTEKQSVENLHIPSGLALDAKKTGAMMQFEITFCNYLFQEQMETGRRLVTALSISIGETRQKRQLKLDKQYVLGMEKIYVIGEEHAFLGIKPSIDILFSNPELNDTAFIAVCKGEAKDILAYELEGYASSADFLEGMIKNSKTYNFFTDNYKIIDVFARLDSEGRNVSLPYIEKTNSGLVITGVALFMGDKMAYKIGTEEAKALNMLSPNAGKGIIAIQGKEDEYADYYGTVKRKVYCSKENGKYTFNIFLNFKGDLVTNQYNKLVIKDVKEKKKLEKKLEEKIKTQCTEFISKMKNVYKLDCLELGRIAAANYGRNTGVDWNMVVADSKINVTVNVKIGKQGRGNY